MRGMLIGVAVLAVAVELQAELASYWITQGDLKAAEGAFQQAIELDPNRMDPYVKLGGLYAAAGRYDEALAKVNDAAKRNPSDVGLLMLEGIIFEQKGEVTKARKSYEKALAINPRLAPAANNLAWIYSEHGGDTLGWILYKRGVYQRALSLLRESAEKLPTNPQVQYHVGMAYAQVGDKDNARKALTAATSTTAEFNLDNRACQHMNTQTVFLSAVRARDYVAVAGYKRCMMQEGYTEGGFWKGHPGWRGE